ncbi:MAG TPA: 8-amino-7-oxononanoate synthase [Actinocrinis sp.]|nr:8-amino-7-oxononanoate synthase [Actinocrinis sp.]
MSTLDWLAGHAAQREADGLRRRLDPRGPQSGHVDLAGNDYLGLNRDPRITAAAAAAARLWGGGAAASRLVTGTTTAHAQLEADLAGFLGAEAALVFSSGYLANVGVLTALARPGDLIVSDALNHASLIDGCRLARARTQVVAHNRPEAVAAALAERTEECAYVVTDAVFSVDGDAAPLAELAEICARSGAVLIADEAHGLGVYGEGGRGVAAAAGLAGAPHVIRTATLSKALGSQGGAVVGSQAVVDHLIDTARSFIFDTGLAPACVGAAAEALAVLRAEPDLPERVRRNATALYGLATDLGLEASRPVGAVTSVVMSSPQAAVAAAACCADLGVRVGCFRPPSVPDGRSRLRLTARADLAAEDFETVHAALTAVAKQA